MEENFNLVLRYTDRYHDRRFVDVYYNSSKIEVQNILINVLSEPDIYIDVEYSLTIASSAIHCSVGDLDVNLETKYYDEFLGDKELEILEPLRDEINKKVNELNKERLLKQVEARKHQEKQSLEKQEAQERELLYKLKQKYEQA